MLEDHFHALFDSLLVAAQKTGGAHPSADYLIDSLPIMLASGTRSKRARVACPLAATGFSAVKQHFYGIRLHLLAKKQTAHLPLPSQVWLREGNVHDLTALREKTDDLPAHIKLFADLAYCDAALKAELKTNHIELVTPIKKPKNKELSGGQKRFNKTVSSFRQPIESFFK